MRRILFPIALLAAAGCAPPKVLVDHAYTSADKSVEAIIQQSGASVGSDKNKTNLFNVFLRVCDQKADNALSGCKDTMILDNVNPKSL